MEASTGSLVGDLADPRGTRLARDDVYRRYAALVTTRATIAGVPDVRLSAIRYEIGRAHASATELLRPAPVVLAPLSTGIRTKSVISGRFENAELGGVVERIAKGLVAWTLYDDITSRDLRHSADLPVLVVDNLDAPFVECHVYITRWLGSTVSPSVMAVLASAVGGEGGTIITDSPALRLVDDTTNEVFPHAALEALRILESNFSAAGAGDVFALCLTTGIHSGLSVVAHTDEGGCLGDLLRAGAYLSPYGSIHTDLGDYAGLPSWGFSSTVAGFGSTVAGYVDAIALRTAGLVAHCDPGQVYQGRWFPCVIASNSPGTPCVQPGVDQPGTASMGDGNLAAFRQVVPRFASLYAPALAKLFGFPHASGVATLFGFPHASGVATKILAIKSVILERTRHFEMASMAPFFWIEPTSLIAPGFTGGPAETEGFAAKAAPGAAATRAFFEGVETSDDSGIEVSRAIVQFRGPRTSGLLDHLNGHPQGGVDAIVPRKMEPMLVIHPGDDEDHPLVGDRLMAGAPLSRYLWVRGASPFAAPAEFLVLGGTVGMQFRHMSYDNDTSEVTAENLPTFDTLRDGLVSYTVGIPSGRDNGPSNHPNSGARRARTHATNALHFPGMHTSLLAPHLPGKPAVDEWRRGWW